MAFVAAFAVGLVAVVAPCSSEARSPSDFVEAFPSFPVDRGLVPFVVEAFVVALPFHPDFPFVAMEEPGSGWPFDGVRLPLVVARDLEYRRDSAVVVEHPYLVVAAEELRFGWPSVAGRQDLAVVGQDLGYHPNFVASAADLEWTASEDLAE